MRSLLKSKLIGIYARFMFDHTRQLMQFSPEELTKLGIDREYLIDFYREIAFRSIELLYFFAHANPNSAILQDKLDTTYFEIHRRVSDILLSASPHIDGQKSKHADFLLKSFERAINTLFTQQVELLSADDDYSVRLGADFDYLKDIDVKVPNSENPEVTVIYPFFNRAVERLELSVKSLRASTQVAHEVIVVDYGSKEPFQSEVAAVCERQGLKLIRVEAQGLPWSRAYVLNVGIKAAQTKYVVTTDIDMLFEKDALAISIEAYKPQSVIHCRPLWLPQDGDKSQAQLGDYAQLGGYQFIEKQVLEHEGAFDERIFFWGLEDIELDKRLKSKGFEALWIDDQVEMYHMWHSFSYGVLDKRPLSSWFDSNETLMQSTLFPQPAPEEYGKVITAADRPILERLKGTEPTAIEAKDYVNQVNKIVEQAQQHKFVKLDFGQRFVNPEAPKFIKFMDPLTKVFRNFGAETAAIKNKNFDYFYLSLPLLKQSGLIDYYMTEDFSSAYLLFA